MQFRTPNVDRTFGRRPRHARGETVYRPRHALGVTAFLTVVAVAAKLAAERRRRSAVPAVTWQAPADAIRAAVVVCDGAIVPTPRPAPPAVPSDPTPTLPLTRAELAEVVEVDGGRPMHDLDHVQRACRHADSMYGRCADCGMTWGEQAAAMGGAR
ncbi:hypothetical protein [Nocardia sp. NPDC055049]